jgi:death on curing protein
VRYLTAEQVLFIHHRLIETTGGIHGVRDLGLLQSAVARPRASFDGRDLHPDLFDKAAALMDAIVHNHPFTDGNKRTGITAAGLLLERNGRRLSVTNAELETFTLHVTTDRPPVPEIAVWLQRHSEPIS